MQNISIKWTNEFKSCCYVSPLLIATNNYVLQPGRTEEEVAKGAHSNNFKI